MVRRDIREAKDLPEAEKVYLVKDWLGWKVIDPVWNPVTKKFSWFNFLLGGKRNAVFVLAVIVIAGLFYLGVSDLLSSYKAIAEEPCRYCASCMIGR